jgi:tRNA threonylcarbamoyl adenosine modification protein (Sua5/YciO/YrdC/YwlC family)
MNVLYLYQPKNFGLLLKIYDTNPNPKQLQQIVDCLQQGGIIVYPTDTIYAIGCSLFDKKAIQKITQIMGYTESKHNFSIICHDLSHLSEYAAHIPNHTFRLMKQCLPGAFTFILPASRQVPKLFMHKKNTVGIRVPNNNIARSIVALLGNPIIAASIHSTDFEAEYSTDPELIMERFGNKVDMVIDGGTGDNQPSTIIDCTTDEIEIIRQGKGILS